MMKRWKLLKNIWNIVFTVWLEPWMYLYMKYLIVSLVILFIANAGVAQQASSCPDKGSEPGLFCLPGTTWDEVSKACVGMA